MPSLQSPTKVLVSGSNGFIAVWVVQKLLDKGYSVRGTVRSAEKGKHLKETFATYGDKFEVAVVADITEEGAFDEAVKGVDAIEHTASPFHFKADDPDELIVPAVRGTTGMLQSALKHGSSVKRIVVTSSCASVLEIGDKPRIFSETDWNEQAIKMIKEQGQDAPAAAKYRASKTLAEKAAWDFVKENEGKIKWDLVVLNPPFVFGPVLHAVSAADELNTSNLDWYKTVLTPSAGDKSLETLAKTGSAWIDVRDLADAHVLALEKAEAGGERIIVSKGPFVWQDWIDVANALPTSSLKTLRNQELPKGTPGAGSADTKTVHMVDYVTTKADKILGLKYKNEKECANDMVLDFGKRGW